MTGIWTWMPTSRRSPILVLGDNDMITQVIYNLLENATKFAREGTALYLGITAIDGRPGDGSESGRHDSGG